MPLRLGETFGRYRVAEALGQGAMGEVYCAYDTVLHRKVALKVLAVDTGAFPGAGPPSTKGAARILREARAAAGITHPNAVAIYDVGEVEGVPFLAMELVAGRTLRTFIGEPSVPLARRIRWAIDVARALGAAHQLGLIHRDIKPENVMVRDDGFVKVLDFGIARRTGAGAEREAEPAPAATTDVAAISRFAMTNGTLTADGVVVGTPMYMAPEQLRGEPLDGRTDQFAWGVLACELFTGKLPWDGEGIAVLSQILAQEVAPLSGRSPEIPARVDAVIRKALSKAPGNRFAAMEEIAAELEPYASSAGGGTRTEAVAISVRDAISTAPTEHASVSGGGTAPSGAIARTIGGLERTARSARPRGRSAIVLAAVAVVVALGAWGVRARSSFSRTPAPVADAAPEDVASPMSSNAEATAAYRAGMQALRDAALGAAFKNLTHAVELDPLFAAAQLRLVPTRLLARQSAMITAAELQGAHAAQASLGTRDRVLLAAFEPVARVPPDFKESERQLEAAVEKYPSDADFPFELALVRDLAVDPPEADQALDVALARDSTFALAWWFKAQVRIEIDDASGGFEAYAQCLKASPGATTCLGDLATIEANEGKCEELVATARRLIALAPANPVPYLLLAEGLAGNDESADAVRVPLQQARDRGPASDRELARHLNDAALAILGGDFAEADRQYEECERVNTEANADVSARFTIAYSRALVDLEVGRTAPALRIADGFLRERAGLSDDGSDSSLTMTTIALAGGKITRARFGQLRDEWLARNQNAGRVNRWLTAYAVPAETVDDAVAAVAVMPAVRPLVNVRRLSPTMAEPIGRILTLGGRLDEGIAYLTKASASCDLLDGIHTIFSTRASFELGSALERRGDTAGACVAYRRVLTRWGRSPLSRTAAKSSARVRALGCAP